MPNALQFMHAQVSSSKSVFELKYATTFSYFAQNTRLTFTLDARNEKTKYETSTVLSVCFPFPNTSNTDETTCSDVHIVCENRHTVVIVDQSAASKVTRFSIFRWHESRVEKDVQRKFAFIRQVTVDESTSTTFNRNDLLFWLTARVEEHSLVPRKRIYIYTNSSRHRCRRQSHTVTVCHLSTKYCF